MALDGGGCRVLAPLISGKRARVETQLSNGAGDGSAGENKQQA